MKRATLGIAAVAAALGMGLLLARRSPAPSPPPATEAPPTAAAPAIPGHAPGADCASCHAAQAQAWTGSHHALATAPLDVAAHAVRFDGRPVRAGALTVTPRPTDGGLGFEVVDAAGTRLWTVRHTLAVAPLQQYLVEADRGRLLVAPIAWDVGAGRWFDPSIEGASGDPADPLYWAGLTGTWNHMCAECHMTGLVEGFDPATTSWSTSWDAMGVTCAACHGADGSRPVDSQAAEVEVCGDCHSRREPVARREGGALLYDHATITLLDEPVYTAQGGIQPGEEAFELGGFLQSKMYAKGVRCVDCHDPHTGKRKAQGDALCLECHAELPPSDAHARHAEVACTTCHMPTATYMGVHARHDHHVRVPDPATSRALGVTDPCTTCHADLDPGPPRDQVSTTFAALVAGGRAGDPKVVPDLHRAVADPGLGAFRRASAAALLRRFPPPPDAGALLLAARDPDPILRQAAIATLAGWGQGRDAVVAALSDPRRAVRLSALRGVFDQRGLGAPWQAAHAEARAWAPHPDSPSTWSNLAVLASGQGDLAQAEADLRTALRIEPAFLPARHNLAALLAQTGRRAEAEQVLAEGR